MRLLFNYPGPEVLDGVAPVLRGCAPRMASLWNNAPAAMIALIALVFGSRPALAALWFNDNRKALPCRPTVACTADIVPPGSFELETGYLFRKLRSPIVQHSVPFLAKLTLAEWMQLQVGAIACCCICSPPLARLRCRG